MSSLKDVSDQLVGGFAAFSEEQDKFTTLMAQAVTSAVRALITKVNGRISLGNGTPGYKAGNLDAAYWDVLTPGVADTEFIVRHDLGRVPVGYQVVRADRSVNIYDSSYGSWTETLMFLKASVASASVKLLIW